MKEGLAQAMLPKSCWPRGLSPGASPGAPLSSCSIWGAQAVAPGMCADPRGVKETALPMASSSLDSEQLLDSPGFAQQLHSG